MTTSPVLQDAVSVASGTLAGLIESAGVPAPEHRLGHTYALIDHVAIVWYTWMLDGDRHLDFPAWQDLWHAFVAERPLRDRIPACLLEA